MDQESRTWIDERVGKLSAAERSAILRMRELKPHVKIEIRLDPASAFKRISIVSTSTLREDFPSSI